MFKQFIIDFEDRLDRFADRARQIKVAKIVRVFKREKELIADVFATEEVIVCGHPGRCAIGALLVAAGEDAYNLLEKWAVTDRQHELLSLEYGLDAGEVEGFMGVNDSVYEDDETGRATNLEYGKVCANLPVTQARACELQAYARTLSPA